MLYTISIHCKLELQSLIPAMGIQLESPKIARAPPGYAQHIFRVLPSRRGHRRPSGDDKPSGDGRPFEDYYFLTTHLRYWG